MLYCPKCKRRAAYLIDGLCKRCATPEVIHSGFVIELNGRYKMKNQPAREPGSWSTLSNACVYKSRKMAEMVLGYMKIGTIKELP